MSDDADSDVIVTDNTTRPARPDNTAERGDAEARAEKIIEDFGKGLISRQSAVRVKNAAKRSINGNDLARGIGRM